MPGAAAELEAVMLLAFAVSTEPPNGIEPLTFSLPWKRSTD